MYKWHVNSAIGRGGPFKNDFTRVADGIAASLRQFSVSISRAEEGDAPKPTRAERGAEAAKDLLTPSRGIDARSLAAKPPQSFTIRRVDETPLRPAGFTPRGRGGFSGDRGGRGGFTPRGRGGTGMRGRGANRGAEPGRGAAGRGRGRGGKRPRGPKKEDDEDAPNAPLNDEELAWMAGHHGGWPVPYEPKTSLESLLGKGTLGIGSARGLLDTAGNKMQVGTDNVNGPHQHADEHLARIHHGHGTMFENTEAKEVALKYLGRQARKQLIRDALPDAEREKLSKAWVAGHYDGPAPVEKGDVLGQVEAYARRNETYLPQDSRKLQAKLASLLPAVTRPKSASGRTQRPL